MLLFLYTLKMNLKEKLLAEHSKRQTIEIVNWIGNNQQRFDALFKLFISEEYRLVQRAAWPLSYAVLANPPLIKRHFSQLLKNLEKPGIHDAVKRNTLRLLQVVEVPPRYHGQLMNLCFIYISTHSEKAAIKAFALTVLQNLSKKYPEIQQEIKTIIQERWPYETAAFKVRAKLFLKEISSKKD